MQQETEKEKQIAETGLQSLIKPVEGYSFIENFAERVRAGESAYTGPVPDEFLKANEAP